MGTNGRPVWPEMQAPFTFSPRRKNGLMISELFPRAGKLADDSCVIRSMYTGRAAHASGCLRMNTGSIFWGKPSLGLWETYRLGAINQSLAVFVEMTDSRGRGDRVGVELDGGDGAEAAAVDSFVAAAVGEQYDEACVGIRVGDAAEVPRADLTDTDGGNGGGIADRVGRDRGTTWVR